MERFLTFLGFKMLSNLWGSEEWRAGIPEPQTNFLISSRSPGPKEKGERGSGIGEEKIGRARGRGPYPNDVADSVFGRVNVVFWVSGFPVSDDDKHFGGIWPSPPVLLKYLSPVSKKAGDVKDSPRS